MFRRIRWRLVATYLVVVLPALAFLGVHLARDSEARYLAQVETGLLAQARLIAVHVGPAVAAGDAARARAEFAGTHYPGRPAVVIVHRSGAVLVDDAPDPRLRLARPVRREGLALALDGQETAGVARVDGMFVVYGAVPIRAPAGIVGAVHVALPLVELAAQLRHIRAFIAWTVLGTLLWAVIVSLLLAQRLAGPIQEMRAATARLAAGDLSVRVPVHTADELGDLARALNYMAAELQRLDGLRRDFVADASHELRTPVANLAVAVEALRAVVTPATGSEETLLRAIEREVDRLRTLVDHLLDLSAIEAGGVHLHLVPVDLARVVRDVVASFQPRAAERRITLHQRLPAGDVTARTDPERLTQILGNLLDNALKFTPAGGQVTVGLTAHRGLATLVVEDTGPGIPPEDLPHIFDRFYKADRARSRQPGAGLGLAIAQRLTAALGGRLEAANRPEGGARFVLTLPG